MIAKRIDNGVVEFVNKKNYWTNKKKYKVFGRRSAPQIFDSSIVDRIEKKADLGNLLILLVYIDNDNMICRYDKHEEKLMGIHDLQGFCNLLKMKERATRDFLKKMMELGIVKKITIAATATEKSYDKFYINPVITMRERAVSLPLYKLFQESLDAVLPPTAISDLQEAWQAEFEGRPLQQRKIDVSVLADDDDDVKEIPDDFLSQLQMDPEVVEIDNAKLKARAAKFNPFLTAKADAIVKEYLYHSQEPHLYAMEDGGMRKAEYSDSKDIYFVVNTPAEYLDKKPKNSDIVNFNAWYVDIDAGKDEDGHYFDVAEVEKHKEMMRNVINQLPLPTYVNVTRNGYHIYFAADGVSSEEEWRGVENKLIETIEIADKAVKDPARLMRAPGSWWHKNDKSAATGCESYHCHSLVANRKKYSAAELLAELDRVAENVKKACDSYQQAFGNINEGNGKVAAKVNVTIDDNARIADIRSLTTTTFVIPAAVTIVDNAKNWLRQQSLAEFLQIANPNSFACVFHNDEHPSATIYHNESGDRYVCAAASCSVSSHGWDIVDCVMALANCDFVTALKYLTTIYNIKEG